MYSVAIQPRGICDSLSRLTRRMHPAMKKVIIWPITATFIMLLPRLPDSFSAPNSWSRRPMMAARFSSRAMTGMAFIIACEISFVCLSMTR